MEKTIKSICMVLLTAFIIFTSSIPVSNAATSQLIIINSKNNTLNFYENNTLVRKFKCATGKSSTPTPQRKTTIVNKIVKVTGSITLFGCLYKLGNLIFTEINKKNGESNNIIRLLLNYSGTIASLVILILLCWFVTSLVFYELSSAQKRKQIDYIFPKLVEEILEEKRKN